MCVDGSNFPKMLLEKLLSYCYFTDLFTNKSVAASARVAMECFSV